MARRRRQEPEPLVDEPPEWLWEFDGRDWGWHSKDLRAAARAGLPIEGRHAARLRWGAACRLWLVEHDLAMWPHFPSNWQEFKRIKQEEPHRILRRPS